MPVRLNIFIIQKDRAGGHDVINAYLVLSSRIEVVPS